MDQLVEVERFLDTLRGFFKGRGYTEVVTPHLLPYPNLDENVYPIPCTVEGIDGTAGRFFLHTSPEYAMKKLLARYKRDIFQICHVFRNREGGRLNDFEFLMLEYYKIGWDYNYLMDEIGLLLLEIFGEEFTYRGKRVEVEPQKLELDEAYKTYLGLDLELLFEDLEAFKKQLEERNIHFEPEEDEETLFFRTYVELERYLGWDRPTFVYGFPEPFGALARCKNGRCERFELYICGVELANGYTEINDPKEVEKRLQEVARTLSLPLDGEFVEIHKNLPPLYAGVSLGIDRLLMLKLGLNSIKELYFHY